MNKAAKQSQWRAKREREQTAPSRALAANRNGRAAPGRSSRGGNLVIAKPPFRRGRETAAPGSRNRLLIAALGGFLAALALSILVFGWRA